MDIIEVETLADLETTEAFPPAMAFVRQTGGYYLYFDVATEIKTTPYYSGIGSGWHPIENSSPRFDRQIWVVNTRWVNGQDLDFYSDFIWQFQGSSFVTWDDLYRIHGSVYPAPAGQDTTLSGFALGDLIMRYERWEGLVAANYDEGEDEIEIDGLETEVNDKYGTKYAAEQANSTIGKPGAVFAVNGKEYGVINHWPNNFDDIDQYDHKSPWKPTTEPTTRIKLATPLTEAINEGDEFVIYNRQWYIASCETLPPCPEHVPHCFPIYRIGYSDSPARFDRVCHRMAAKAVATTLKNGKRALPGDLGYNEAWQNWYQFIMDSEVTAHVTRYAMFANRGQFNAFKGHYNFNNTFILNMAHEQQSWQRQVPARFASNFEVTMQDSRFLHKPADWCYYKGAIEP